MRFYAVSYSVCKKLMTDANFNLKQYINRINVIDNFVQEMRSIEELRLICDQWLNCIILNTAAVNNEYRQQVSQSLSLSFHSLQSELDKNDWDVNKKVIANLQQVCSESMAYFISMPCIGNILQQIQKKKIVNERQHRNIHQVQYALCGTINYLCIQKKIMCKYDDKIKKVVAYLNNCQCHCADVKIEEFMIQSVNQLLFGDEKADSDKKLQVKTLQLKLSKNYNASLLSIASLIDSNYYSYEICRPTFEGCWVNGAQLMEELIRLMVRLYDKNDLFSEKMLEVERTFQLFMVVIEYRHLDVFAHWLTILQKYISNQNIEVLIKDITNFLFSMPNNHHQFIDILKCMYSQLIKCKHIKNIAVDIIKKFVLNRFLLDPSLYYAYSRLLIGQQDILIIFNKIKILFYPKKAQTDGLYLEAERISATLENLLSNPNNTKTLNTENLTIMGNRITCNKNVVYHSDRELNRDYLIVYADLIEKDGDGRRSHHETRSDNSNKLHNNSDRSYQLSFSFITPNTCKDFNSKYQILNEQKAKIYDHKGRSIASDVDKLKWKTNNIINIGSPISQKSRKTTFTEFTENETKRDNEIEMIEELIAKRRALGTARKIIDQRKSRKAKERQKKMYYFNQVHYDFQNKRRTIQLSSSVLITQIHLI